MNEKHLDLQREVEFFDRFGTEHEEYDVLGEEAYGVLLEWFQKLVQPKSGERCVDLGCGTGAFTKRLGAFELTLTGVDISSKCIERAQRNHPEARYLVGDITHTEFESDSFDIIVYSGVLHHVPERRHRVSMLREGYRILRPGGRLFSFDPHAHSPSMFLYRDPRSPFFSSVGKTENEILLSRGMYGEELREVGFSSIALRGVGGITYRYVESARARRLLAIYNCYERVLKRLPFENLLGTFLLGYGEKPGERR